MTLPPVGHERVNGGVGVLRLYQLSTFEALLIFTESFLPRLELPATRPPAQIARQTTLSNASWYRVKHTGHLKQLERLLGMRTRSLQPSRQTPLTSYLDRAGPVRSGMNADYRC